MLRNLQTYIASAPAPTGLDPLVSWPGGGRFAFAQFSDAFTRARVARFALWMSSVDEAGDPLATAMRAELVGLAGVPGRPTYELRRLLVDESAASDVLSDNLGHGWIVPFPQSDPGPFELRVSIAPTAGGLVTAQLDVWFADREAC